MSVLAIETKGLSKEYRLGAFGGKRVKALLGLNLSIPQGEILGLLGPNGAGKSTTIKLLLNLIRPTAGSAKVFGYAPSDAEGRSRVGFLPENPAPYEYLTGIEFVTLAAQMARVPGAGLKKRVGEVIEQVGMSRAAVLPIRKYSKGMIQRITLAQSLVSDPGLLILDEPTSGLDILGRRLVSDIILDQRKRGTTVILCSHIIPDVEVLADRVVVLIGGKLVKDGKVSELISNDKDALVEATIDGLSGEALEGLGPLVKAIERLEGRVVLRFEERATRDVLHRIHEVNGRVLALQKAKYSLENMFLDALKSTDISVGSSLS